MTSELVDSFVIYDLIYGSGVQMQVNAIRLQSIVTSKSIFIDIR